MIDYSTGLAYGWMIPEEAVENLKEKDPYLFEELWDENGLLFALNSMSAKSPWMLCSPSNILYIERENDFCCKMEDFTRDFRIRYSGEEMKLIDKVKPYFSEYMKNSEREYIFTQVY